MKNSKSSKKFVVEHASNDWTKGKIQAAYENGYLKYEELSQDKRIEIDKELATMFVVCTPALVKFVCDVQNRCSFAVFEVNETPIEFGIDIFLKVAKDVLSSK